MLLGASALLATLWPRRRALADAAAVGAGLIALIGVLAGVSGLDALSALPGRTPLPLETAIALLALAVGMSLVPGPRSVAAALASPGPQGSHLRLVVPMLLAGPLVVGAARGLLVERGVVSPGFGNWLLATALGVLLLSTVWRVALLLRRLHLAERAQLARFETLVGSLDGHLIWTMDRRLRHTGFYGRWAVQLADRLRPLLGKPAGHGQPPEVEARFLDASRSAMAGEATTFEWDVERSVENGTPVWMRTTIAPLYDGDAIAGLVGITADVTGLRLAQDEAREARDAYADILARAEEAVVMATPAGELEFANHRLCEMLGYESLPQLRRAMPDLFGLLVDPDAPAQVLAQLAEGPVRGEFELRRRDGDSAWVRASVVPLRGADGELEHLQAMLTDITSERRERALRAEAEDMSRRAWREAVGRIAAAVEYRDADTGAHITRMAEVCALIARTLGLPEERCRLILEAAPMHDAGKVAVPDAVLLKPGPLTAQEREVMQRHAQLGHDLLRGSGSEVLELAADIALHHHERMDGTGYPQGLRGEEIPIEGRIAAVADVFDALTHDRPYRPAFDVPTVVAMLEEGRGTQFDPQVLDALLGHLDEALALEGATPAAVART